MSMFRGINGLNIDEKGRFVMPTRYRQALLNQAGGRVVLTIDPEAKCLLLYPMNAWEGIEAQIEALPSFNKTTRRIQRLLLGHATEMEMDKAGRILLPSILRDYAGIEKDMILLGQGKKFELWAEGHWQQERAKWLSEDSGDEGELPEQLGSIAL